MSGCILCDARRCPRVCCHGCPRVRVPAVVRTWEEALKTPACSSCQHGCDATAAPPANAQVSLKRRRRRSWRSSSSQRSALTMPWRVWSALCAWTRSAKWCGWFPACTFRQFRGGGAVAVVRLHVGTCQLWRRVCKSMLWLGAVSLKRELCLLCRCCRATTAAATSASTSSSLGGCAC